MFHSIPPHIILETLVKSKGNPENWENSSIGNADRIGLAIADRELSEQKLSAFSNFSSSYAELKEKIGLEEFDFFFEFNGVDDVNAGLEPQSNANEVVSERLVIYKGGIAVAKLKLYKLE